MEKSSVALALFEVRLVLYENAYTFYPSIDRTDCTNDNGCCNLFAIITIIVNNILSTSDVIASSLSLQQLSSLDGWEMCDGWYKFFYNK